MAAIKRGTHKVTPAFSMEGEGAGASTPAAKTPSFPKAKSIIMQMSSLFLLSILLKILEENKKKKMEGIKKLAVFTICMMMLVVFGNVGGAMAAGEEAPSPSPSPSMESAAITLFVPVLMAAFASLAAFFF
ncbi:hypothetical protein HAX54_024647 [Datura stramonium]|uniref:Uncharacterized protein n=1 Tax=Datura stramonium TaxID=4076 RepID=A0ABS8RHX8_DATST|nr:hypothetical protein [Datura stramonium]